MHIKAALQKVQQMPNLQTSSETGSEISVFRDEQLDQKTFAMGMGLLKTAFPRLTADWFELLKLRCREKGFTNKQFAAAVNNLIDNCVYPEPTIAQILSYDVKVQKFTYNEVLKRVNEGDSFENYAILKDKSWVRKTDKIKYGLE